MRDIKAQEIIKVDFTPHDLRRTASTMMTSMGTPLPTVSKILNHSEAGVTAKHFGHYAYAKEKQSAMCTWGKNINQILTNLNNVKSKQSLVMSKNTMPKKIITNKKKEEINEVISYEQSRKFARVFRAIHSPLGSKLYPTLPNLF